MARSRNPLGLATLTAIVIASMIGAGVFTTSGFALGDLGSPWIVLLAWSIGGLIALTGALSYGALIRLMPESGGEYLFLSRNVHPLLGFLGGWVSLLAGFTGAIAFAAITFAAYAAPSLSGQPGGRILASALILGAAALHGIRLAPGARAQNLAVAVKLAVIIGFSVYAFAFSGVGEWPGWSSTAADTAPAFSITTFALSLMWISLSYSGFNGAVYIAGEVPNGATLVPRALVIGTAITMLAYLSLNTIFVFAPGFDAVAFQEDVAAIAARAVGGENLEHMIRALIALALFTSVSVMIMIAPRVYAKMADDGVFPRWLRFEGEVPAAAIWSQALLASAVVWIAGLRELLSYLGFTLGLSTAAAIASLYLVTRKRSGLPALPGYPWAPAIYVVCTLAFATLGATQSPVEMLAAILTIVSGVALYFLLAGRQRHGQPGDNAAGHAERGSEADGSEISSAGAERS